MKKMMMKERHSYIIRTALMAASGILLCGIAEAVRPEVDLSVGVPADKVVIADGILDQETQNDTDESFCDRLMKKMVHPIHMASRFLNGLGADSEEYVPSETEYNLMALRTEESAVDLSDPLAAFESLPWYKLAKRFRSMGTEDTWGAKMYEALGTRDAQWISEIYGWIQTTPLTASQKMGLPAAQVLGSYDPSNPEHNAQDPASWVVPTWKNIRFQICDGDGKPTSLASNATDILSMANVYTYSLDWKNTDLFNTYINQLWTSSHQYHVSISNVYYCEGCTELPDEPATEGTADDDVESGSAAGEASSEALDAQGAGDSQTAAEEPLTESEAASTANNYVKPAQGPGASTQEQAAESKAAESKKNQTTETKKDSSKKDSSKNNSSSSNSSASSDYVLPGSSSQYLSASDVKNLSSYQLMIARNEIYARHGRKFNDSELQAYFNGKSWYKGTVNPEDFSTSVFNDCEIKNIQLIQSYE